MNIEPTNPTDKNPPEQFVGMCGWINRPSP